MASKWYGQGLLKIGNGSIRWTVDTIKVMIVNAGYTFDADHEFVSDVSASELSGTGYAGGFAGSGRKTAASKTVTNDTVNNRIEYDLADAPWAGIDAGVVAGLIFIHEDTNDGASSLLAFLDPPNITSNSGTITVVFDAEGALQIGYA